MAWIPRYGGIGLGISILSYAGQVRLGVISDQRTVPDPENIIAAFRDEVDTLLALARERQRPLSVKELPGLLDAAIATLDELLSEGRVVQSQGREILRPFGASRRIDRQEAAGGKTPGLCVPGQVNEVGDGAAHR